MSSITGSPVTPSARHPRWRHGLHLLALCLCIGGGRSEAAPRETDPIFRAQVTIRTCNLANADTDNLVFASLRPGNSTALNYGRDDFPRNDTFTYDLVLDGVSQFADITRLQISKQGSDAVCLRTIELRTNGRRIFRRNFGAAGRWLDNGGGFTLEVTSTGNQLRNGAFWQIYRQPEFSLGDTIVMTRAELESRVEATAATQIANTPVDWGGLSGPRFVQASRVNASTLHFDLDTQVDTLAAMRGLSQVAFVAGAFDTVNGTIDDINGVLRTFGLPTLGRISLPNRNVDIDFDMSVTCSDNALTFGIGSPVVDVDTIPSVQLPTVPGVPGLGVLVNILNGGIATLNGGLDDLHDAIEATVEDALAIDPIEAAFATPLAQIGFAFETPLCPVIGVQQNGDLTLGLTL